MSLVCMCTVQTFVLTYSESVVTAKIYTASAKSDAVCSGHIAINMYKTIVNYSCLF